MAKSMWTPKHYTHTVATELDTAHSTISLYAVALRFHLIGTNWKAWSDLKCLFVFYIYFLHTVLESNCSFRSFFFFFLTMTKTNLDYSCIVRHNLFKTLWEIWTKYCVVWGSSIIIHWISLVSLTLISLRTLKWSQRAPKATSSQFWIDCFLTRNIQFSPFIPLAALRFESSSYSTPFHSIVHSM